MQVRTQEVVFVVGCPRSGTSPFAHWLHACGLFTVSDLRRDARYPAGYYEHLPVLMFHKGLERLPRGADHRITTEPFLKSELLEVPFIAETFLLAFRPLLEGDVDFFKYPQLALSLDFVFEQFPSARVVALWRDPAETFRSLVTKEFPVEMLPGALFKSILLWNVYAHHIVRAKRRWPDAVTVVRIDGFLEDREAGRALMDRIGRPRDQAVLPQQALERGLWRSRSGTGWRLYHAAMATACRMAAPCLGSERATLADQRAWLRALRDVTDVGVAAPRSASAQLEGR